MVSYQPPSSFPSGREKLNSRVDHGSIRKRKWENPASPDKRAKRDSCSRSVCEVELQMETPLPLEWQRCLDIQSGQIHFYNTRTHKRTWRDPRRSPEPPSSPKHTHMSLELELNLPCDSQRKASDHEKERIEERFSSPAMSLSDLFKESGNGSNKSYYRHQWPSWLACDGDHEDEMVATACTRCHMLVMLCKSAPACPNCKFMHPQEGASPKLLKPSLSLLC